MHREMAQTLDRMIVRIRELQSRARSGEAHERPRWPMLVLSTPKGWTGPDVVDGQPVEGSWRSHQVPLAKLAEKPEHLRQLEEWMQSYRPQELFTAEGRLQPKLRALAPAGRRRMSDNPHANGGTLLRDLRLPDFREYARRGRAARGEQGRGDAGPGRADARRHATQRRGGQFPHLQPGRAHLEPLGRRAGGDLAHVERASSSTPTRTSRTTVACSRC